MGAMTLRHSFNAARHALPATALLCLVACGSPAPPADPPKPAVDSAAEGHIKDVQAWRETHETNYRRNWVTIAGLHDLKPGRNRAGNAPTSDVVLPKSVPSSIGTFVLTGQKVRYEPNPIVKVLLRDQPVTAPIDLKDDSEPGADVLTFGDVQILVHASGPRRSIRVRDPGGEQAKSFAGFTWFPIDTKYRVIGKLIRDAEPKRLKVLNTIGDEDEYPSEGVVEFTLMGETVRLRPFTTRPKRFYFVFRDASSGAETYETARFLYSDLLDDGTTVLDFNQAYNPPCAFNPYTTCPIPLKENRLPVKILAGEKAYAGKS
jgi:uncharacterized protein (DUF1684 family)